MPAPDRIKQLIETFEQNIAAYRSQKNETELRRQFLDPFFEALGWDVDNKKGFDERSKEVAHEYSVEIDGAQKKADYAFRTGRDSFDFLVEAKKPSVKIESNLDAAFQIRRYGWSAGLPINILTDFEHFAIYDCRTRPNYSKDKVGTGLLKIIHYKEYIERWDEIAGVFSPDAIRKGALDTYKDGLKGKKGTQEVDDAFLEEIEGWRETLAKNIALRNKPKNLTEDQINFAVQMTIDRIIFLRIAEERGMEKDRRLFELTTPPDPLRHSLRSGTSPKSDEPQSDLGEAGRGLYSNLLKLFHLADARYNSGLFHFKAEKDRESPDALTPALEIDDKVLKDIIKDLYYPSPYAFNYIPADILGSVYERFLGKVIRLTADRNAKVDEKPEVRKAGGVYYTPTYIVDYIVKNTVGKLLSSEEEQLTAKSAKDAKVLKNPGGLSELGGSKELTPDEVSKIKIVDPACGSGSFLLGAFQFLLDWHLDWYVNYDLERSLKKKILLTADNKTYRLSLNEKKRILLNNIHGVDIDPQAVEVTKLSLLLKVVEDPGQLTLFEEGHILPNLNKNIKNGNALIGTDYFSGQMFGDMDEMKRVKPFEWKDEFPDVFKRGGFDVVIGNPPYVRMETFKEIKEYLRKNYACHEERADIYAYIIERAHKILRLGGLFGMIVSNKFLRANYGKPLRNFIQKNANINRIVDFAGLPVFKGATVRTIVVLTSRETQKEFLQYSPPLPMDIYSAVESGRMTVENAVEGRTYPVSNAALTKDVWSFAEQDADDLLSRLAKTTTPLVEYCDGLVCMGIKSGLTEAFVIDAETRAKIIKENSKAVEIIKPFLNGRDIRRYIIEPKDIFLIYTYHGVRIVDYPAVENYLKPYKEQLKKRATKQEWYELQQPQFAYVKYFDSPKIIFPDIATAPRFVLDEGNHYGSNTMYFIPRRDLYLLGLLNSKLALFYFRIVCAGLEGKNETYLRFFGQYLEGFPVANAEKSLNDKMVVLVEQMLSLHKNVGRDGIPPNEKELLERQIKSTDRQIDELVYQLYGLTPEEIKIVEGD